MQLNFRAFHSNNFIRTEINIDFSLIIQRDILITNKCAIKRGSFAVYQYIIDLLINKVSYSSVEQFLYRPII